MKLQNQDQIGANLEMCPVKYVCCVSHGTQTGSDGNGFAIGTRAKKILNGEVPPQLQRWDKIYAR